MPKRKFTYSDFLLFIANLIPLYGVWFEGWDPKQMFLVYCLETIIIGGFNVIKMIIITHYKKKDYWESNQSISLVSGWFFILFFIFHYGVFVFVQTGIFTGVTGLSDNGGFEPISFIGNIFHYLNYDAKIVLYIFITMYGLKMMIDFILNGQYRKISLGMQMFQPYLRIIIQQFVVIIGSIFLAFGAGKIFMLIFVCIKLYFELFINFDGYLEKAQRNNRLKQGENND